MIHSTSFWIINFYLLPWIGINDLIIKILLSGFILTGITTITAKLDLRKKEVAVILILFILIILFNFNTSNINLNNQSPDNTNNIDPLCKEKVEYIIGNHFIISYRTKENINSRELKSFSTKFLGSSEQFESDSYSVMGIEYSPLGQSKTTDRKVINSNIRLGEKQGENKDWLYGNINYEYTYTKKDIVDDKGIILGDNHFKITVKIDDLSSYFPKYYVVDSESPNGKSLHLSIPISIENIVTVTECSLVDYEIFHSKFDI